MAYFKKFIATMALSLVATVSSANAAFNLSVAYVSGGPGTFTTFNSGASSGGPTDLIDGNLGTPPNLVLTYSGVTSIPTAPTFDINFLSVVYSGNPNPITFDITLSESAAQFPAGAPTPLYGYGGYFVSNGGTSSVGATYDFGGTGGFTIPQQNAGAGTAYFGDTIFNSPGLVGPISTTFRVTLGQNENISFIANAGVAGVSVTPAPAAALVGLFAVPTLAMLRRRIRK